MRLRSRVLAPLLSSVLLVGITSSSGCAPALAQAPASAVLEGQREIAEVHKARCGNCHVRVEPGTRTRAQLEAAFTRHRSRVHLREADWRTMVDYLASSSGE